jgi:hypothetical protein
MLCGLDRHRQDGNWIGPPPSPDNRPKQNREAPRLTRFTVNHTMAARVGTAIVDLAMLLSRFVSLAYG